VKKRPNPAVADAERAAVSTEELARLAATTMSGANATPNNLKSLAQRRRTTADKIRKTRPYLIASE